MININLIAERRARKQRETTILRMSTLGVVLVVFAMLALNLAWWQFGNDEQRKLKSSITALDKAHDLLKSFVALKTEVEQKREIGNLLGRVQLSEGAWMVILSDLSHTIPNDVVLTALATDTENDAVTLRLSGRAKDQQTVGAFMKLLREGTTGWVDTPRLVSVTLNDNKTLGTSVETFEITVPVKGLYGGEL